DQRVEARLHDRHLAPLQLGDPGLVDVGTYDVVSQVGEARRGRQPDVARPDDGDLRHEFYLRPANAPASRVRSDNASASVLGSPSAGEPLPLAGVRNSLGAVQSLLVLGGASDIGAAIAGGGG